MALGCLLWISWICFLLFDGSSGLPTRKGYGYPYKSDSRNLGDDEDVWDSLSYDSDWQPSNSQPTDSVYTSYNKPSVAQPVMVPTQQNLPETPSAPVVERPVNGDPRDWGLENLDGPLTFPSKPNYLQSEPAKPQATSLNVASSNSMGASPSTGGTTQHASLTAYYEPSASQAAKPPSFDSWWPAPVSGGYEVADSAFGSKKAFSTGSTAHGGNSRNIPHLVFEEVFQYASEPSQSHGGISSSAGGYSHAPYTSKGSFAGYASDPSFLSYPATPYGGAQPVYAPGTGSSSYPSAGGEYHGFGQASYQPHETSSPWLQQNPVGTQRVSEPILPTSSPVFSFQSRRAYQHGRYVFAESRYTPDFPPPMPVSSPGFKGPATNQPAAPKGAWNP